MYGLKTIPVDVLVISNILSNILLFLFVAGSLNAFEYDCTFSKTFLKSSTLNVNGISSSSYRSSNTCPVCKLDIVPDGFVLIVLQILNL